MATLYLHIGMHKTGTTAIQYFMAHNRKNLKAHGAVYPDFGLRYEWVNKDRNGHWLTKAGFSEETAPQCFAKVNRLADTYEKIILSDEGFWTSRGFRPEFWEYVRENLRDDIGIKVIACIRRQDLFAYSYWAEQVKAQQPIDFKTFTFQEFVDAGIHKTLHINYQKYFEPVLPLIGRENILLRVFEKDKFTGGSIYADFMDAIGLELNDSYKIPQNQKNLSIKGSVLEAKRRLNFIPEFSEPGNRVLKYMFEAQEALQEQGRLVERTDFPIEERRKFLEFYRESNEWTAKNILGHEDGSLFDETLPEDREQAEPYTGEEVRDVYGQMMLAMLAEIKELKAQTEELQAENEQLKESSDSLLGRAKRKLRG